MKKKSSHPTTGKTGTRFSKSSDPHSKRSAHSPARKTKPARSASPTSQVSLTDGERLQKILAAAGFGSRRSCEELIVTGRVEIDRKTVTELGTKVDPARHEIRVDGEALPKIKRTYILLFKPKGYLCTHADQQGRKRAIDLLPPELGRLFPVGRLDMHSEGLLLLTNDGTLTEQLTHPRFGVRKVYRVLVAGAVDHETLQKIREGVHLAEGFVRPEKVVLKSHYKQGTVLDITLAEGKNREIRRMLARLEHKVLQLIRIAIGPIKTGKMLPGEWRPLSTQEVRMLYTVGEQATEVKKEKKTSPKRKSGS